MDRGPQTTGRSGGRGRTRGAHSGRTGGGRTQDGGRGGRGGDRPHNRQPSKDDNQHGGGGAGRERNHGGRGGHRDHGPGKGGRHARGASTFSSGSPRPGTAPDGGPTPAEATPQQSPTKLAPESAAAVAPAVRPQAGAGHKPGGSWANLLKSSAPTAGAAAATASSGSTATTSANNIATATAPAAPSAAAVIGGTAPTPSSATAAAAAAASTAAAPEVAAPVTPAPPTAAAAIASMPKEASAAPPAAPSTEGRASRPQSEAIPAPSAKPVPVVAPPTPPIDYAAAVSANAPQTAAAVVAGGNVAPAHNAAPVAPAGAPSAPGVAPGSVPAMVSGAPATAAAAVSGAVPIVAAPGVPIPVGPIHNMQMPGMPAISVQGPVPGGQAMPASAGRGQGAAMSPRPGGPGGPGPTYNAAAVIQGPRPGHAAFMYAAPMQYGGRMMPAAYHMAGVPMNANARMGPHYAPHMMPMGGRNYKQSHQGGRGGGRGGGGGNMAAPSGGSSGASAPAAEGATPGTPGGGAGRGPGRGAGASQEPAKQGLTIHRAGAAGAPVRTRPQSAVEPRSTTPQEPPFDSEGKGMTTPRSQQRSASAISHRSDVGTPTLDSTPKKLAIRKPGSTPSKSPDKSGRPASGNSASTQSTASPQKPEPVTVRKGSPDENECPEPINNGAAPTANAQATEDGAASLNAGGAPKSAAAAAADAAATAACASVAATSTPAVTARETRSQAVNSQSAAPSPTPPEDLPPPPAAAPPADEATPPPAPTEATPPPPPPKPLADASTNSAKPEPTAKTSESPPTSASPPEDLPPPPPHKPPQPVSTAVATEAAPPPPTPAQPTETPAPQGANGARKRMYTRKFMCAVQNIPGEPVNKYGISVTREDLRNITFDDLDDKFIGTMHKLLHRDDTGIIATEERRQSIQERSGNMRMRRTGSHANRGDDGGRGGGGRGARGGGMWNEDHAHSGSRAGRGSDRSSLSNHRQGGSGNRDDQWGRRTAGGNDRQGPGSFSEWSANKKAAPPPPGAEMLRAENAYKKGKLLSDDPEEEAKQRTFTSLINKLTIDNFDRIVGHMGAIHVDDAKTLKGFVDKIFHKALTESIFCEMYASLCKHLLKVMPRFETETTNPDGTKKTIHQDIRSLVLSECQYQFGMGRIAKANAEANAAAEAEILDDAGMTDQEKKVAIAKRDEENLIARRRAMGNMQFVGHLYKAAMITEKIVHVCFQELLKDPTSEEVECVCKLLATAGPFLQNAKHNPELFPVYVGRLEKISNDKEKFDSRIRFLILDTLELVNNQWQGRVKPEGPRRIDEIHKDAMMEEQKAKERNNTRGYDRRGGGNYGGYQQHGPPRPPQMDIRVNPRAMNTSMLPTAAVTSGRPGGQRRPGPTHSAGSDRSNDSRDQHGGRGGGPGSWSNRHQSSSDREPAGGPVPLPPPPPRPAPGKEAAPAAEPAAQMTTEEVRRKVKLMIGEFGSSQKEDEAVLSCEELMAKGTSAAAVHAHLLCELTSMHKEEAEFTDKRDSWLQMLQKPLGDATGKDILKELMQLLPELFDENIKAVKLIGDSLGSMLTSKQLTPTDLFEAMTAPDEDGEEAQLVDSGNAAPLFMAAITASDTDIAALKASSTIDAKALVPSYMHSKLQEHAAKTGLDQLL